jgi:hypothetical protein
MTGTGSYYVLCIEYTLHYNVTSLVCLHIYRLTLDHAEELTGGGDSEEEEDAGIGKEFV